MCTLFLCSNYSFQCDQLLLLFLSFTPVFPPRSALQRERHLVSQLRDSLDEERGSQQDLTQRERQAVQELQASLDTERARMLDMQAKLDRERHKVQVSVACEGMDEWIFVFAQDSGLTIHGLRVKSQDLRSKDSRVFLHTLKRHVT